MPITMQSITVLAEWIEVDISSKFRIGLTTNKMKGCLVVLGDQLPGSMSGNGPTGSEPPSTDPTGSQPTNGEASNDGLLNGEGAVLVTSERPFFIEGLTGERLFLKSTDQEPTYVTLTS